MATKRLKEGNANIIKLRSKVQISWKPHADGWVAINLDGSTKEQGGLTPYGTLIRGHDGRWFLYFSFEILFPHLP
ncbi:hypothetical protein JHK85_000709 [Glycine max]|nr:hypothetical protein JHK85_000709 [Glycine max]